MQVSLLQHDCMPSVAENPALRRAGMLTGKYSADRLPAGPRGILFRQILPGLEPLLDMMRQIAASRRKTVSQVTEPPAGTSSQCSGDFNRWSRAAAS